uniref:Lectin n=1 Tax=Phaseolus lunatus TaxID=3884 RepID=LEC_PHALU|nr:RecName: Full=Lectin; AltName: Full=LBL; Flags: Precursor [Phaseolus lunatus]AAA33768.1 lectin (LBL) precursor [Phaseolus lunatus]
MASSVLLVLSLFLVLLLTQASAELFFNFQTFNAANLILQGNAVSSKGHLLLTNVTHNGEPSVASSGRALYSAPIQIRDSTGNASSTPTSHSYTLQQIFQNVTDDPAWLFALVPVDSQPKKKGRLLGLFNKSENDINALTVAVEFDTCHNLDWDKNSIAVNLGIGSVPWNFRDYDGQNADVLITYDSSTKFLAVSLFYPITGKRNNVSANVELEKVLDDWVSVGFSATSGAYETHDVLSSSFASKLSSLDECPTGENLLNKIL